MDRYRENAMEQLEEKANQLFEREDYGEALNLFNRCLDCLSLCTENDITIRLLRGRSACLLKQKRYNEAISDCEKVMKLHCEEAWAQQRLIFALCCLGRVPEALATAQRWHQNNPGELEAMAMLSRLKELMQRLDEQKEEKAAAAEGREGRGRGEAEEERLLMPTNPNAEEGTWRRDTQKSTPMDNTTVRGLHCSYCNQDFLNKTAFAAHCHSAEHQMVLMSDEGREWKHRPPPRGIVSEIDEPPSLCREHSEQGQCRLGVQCVGAHGEEELREWLDRLAYRRLRLERAQEARLYGGSYAERLLERWFQATRPQDVMAERKEGLTADCQAPLTVSVATKVACQEWVFTVQAEERMLRRVALLYDTHRNHFSIESVMQMDSLPQTFSVDNRQEWQHPRDLRREEEEGEGEGSGGTGSDKEESSEDHHLPKTYQIVVAFRTDIFGTFRQTVVFDVGTEPVLIRHLCVDVVPLTQLDKLQEVCISCDIVKAHKCNPEGDAVILIIGYI